MTATRRTPPAAHRPRPRRARVSSYARTAAAALLATVATAGLLTATGTPAVAAGECNSFPDNDMYPGTPWSLQRVLLDELWAQSTGKGVRVAVIDTGVDTKNKQLKGAVDVAAGNNFLPKKDDKGEAIQDRGNEHGTTDTVGHGTKAAGIIAARRAKGTGFVGLAREATIIPIKQNDAEGHGKAELLADAIAYAVQKKADVINISQDTAGGVKPAPSLENAVEDAIRHGVVVVASAGNNGAKTGKEKTYPASYPGVLAVGASDRNNERALFSQRSGELGVAAPGVDMVSTVPGKGHCSDDGTSFSAPYVSGVAALIVAKHRDWTPKEIIAQIEQTADRTTNGWNINVGWGVVDPVRALTEDDHPIEKPVSHQGLTNAQAPEPAPLHIGETEAERSARLGTYVALSAVIAVAVLSGTGVAVRDARRRRRRVRGQE
ncbi:type VII secretion-associated serine protease mycosin [Streptomyces odontomachi]|uniref:type VII secretion-associated serine protease mycosin n=1 Tax=Streptomyces odontomachi TaxID=2944940 RepID=UPI00210A4037|nr:type VII secretion-associated serine protease mycosin [Streptomyces sp. ODS25]